MGPGMNQVRASIPGSMGGMQQQQQAPPTQVRPGLAPPSTSMPSTQPQIGGVATSVGGAGGTGGFPGTSNIPSSFGQVSSKCVLCTYSTRKCLSIKVVGQA